jgi:hypothetical protein
VTNGRFSRADRDAESAHADADRCVYATADAGEARQRESWNVENTRVVAADATAAHASVFSRRGVEQSAQQARGQSIARYGRPPARDAPLEVREQWRRDTERPGANAELDRRRARAAGARRRADALASNPAPQRPAEPTRGTPAQENAEDDRLSRRGH